LCNSVSAVSLSALLSFNHLTALSKGCLYAKETLVEEVDQNLYEYNR